MRILVATDQPYWQRNGGAQQRIYNLLSGLLELDDHLAVGTFFLGDPTDVAGSAGSTKTSVGQESQLPGPMFCPRDEVSSPFYLRWLKLWKQSAAKQERKPNAAEVQGASQPTECLTLKDYRWAWVLPHFRKAVENFKPDVVLLEYVTMVYLREAVSDSEIVWALDTHDLLSERCRMFEDAGQNHWLKIDTQQELERFQATDLLIAIKSPDAQWMKEMLPEQPVVIAKHAKSSGKVEANAYQVETCLPPVESAARSVGFGFIASDNFPNRQAIDFLLEEVWPEFVKRNDLVSTPRLVVAGDICNYLTAKLPQDSDWWSTIEVCGRIKDLVGFYRSIQVALSPMTIGTGLKIKTSEAVGFGKPVVASPHSATGFCDADCGVIVVETGADWVDAMRRLVVEPDWLEQMREKAQQYAAENLQQGQVYDRLHQVLLQMVVAKKS